MAPGAYLEIDRDGSRFQYWVWRIRSHRDHRILATSPRFTHRELAEDELRLAAAAFPATSYWDRDSGEWVRL